MFYFLVIDTVVEKRCIEVCFNYQRTKAQLPLALVLKSKKVESRGERDLWHKNDDNEQNEPRVAVRAPRTPGNTRDFDSGYARVR